MGKSAVYNQHANKYTGLFAAVAVDPVLDTAQLSGWFGTPCLPSVKKMGFIPCKLPDAGAQLGLVCNELRISYAAPAILSVWYAGRGSRHQRGLTSGILVGTARCVSSGICLFPEVDVNTELRAVAEVMDDD